MEGVYKEIELADSLKLECCHAAHVMVYAKWPGKLFGKYELKYAVMMQVRFDGALGFPGGILDPGETPAMAVTREFIEEAGSRDVVVMGEDHMVTHHSKHTGLCLHFFAKEVSMEQFVSAERSTLQAKHWAEEVMGIVRCPLYSLPNGLGFPAFLRHQFIGHSRDQLLLTLGKRGLMTSAELHTALQQSTTIDCMVTKDELDY